MKECLLKDKYGKVTDKNLSFKSFRYVWFF